jgi:hypothetical protein
VNAQAAVAGLGSGSGAGAHGRSGVARVTIRHRQKIRAVLRHGIRVSCLAAGSGRCSAVARGHGKRLARGSAKVALGRKVSFGARPTRSGRRTLRAALRHRKRVTTTVSVALPGAHVKRRVVLVP